MDANSLFLIFSHLPLHLLKEGEGGRGGGERETFSIPASGGQRGSRGEREKERRERK